MTAFPLRYAHGNILIGRGEARAALYRVETTSYPFLPEADKRAMLRRLARLVYSAEADVSLWRVNRAYPSEFYVEQAMGMLDERHAEPDGWERYLEGHQAYLGETPAFSTEVYLAVALAGARPPQPGVAIMKSTDRLRGRLGGFRGVEPIWNREIKALQEQEERALVRVENSGIRARRATVREFQWLLRRTPCRGVTEPMLDDYWKPPAMIVEDAKGNVGYEPLQTSIERHANAPIMEEERVLVVDGEEARSYQAMLALGALPEDAEFPGGAELLFGPMELVRFAVDAVIHAHYISNTEAIRMVRRKVVDADNAYSEQASSTHGAMSFSIEENRSLARELLAYLESPEHPPLLRASVGLAVGASTREELENRVELLRGQFGTVMLHRPLGLQPAMFFDHLPRADGGSVHDYDDILTIEQLAAFMPTGTHITGAEKGAYIAHTISGGQRPVLFDITEASRVGRPPSMLLAGTLGSGKTIAAQLLALQAERRGSLVVDIDPKPDHNLEALPELKGRVHVIELTGAEQFRGLLDPLVVAPESMREDLASSYLVGLLPQAPPTWHTQVVKAVRHALTFPNPSCSAVLNTLDTSDNPDARDVGEALGVWAGSGLGRLAFSDGNPAKLSTRRPVTTIKARGLALPSPGTPRSDFDQTERLSVATLKLIAAFAMQLVTGDRSVHKVLLFDEAWFLLASYDGRRLIDRLNRQGRTENVTLILATQQLSDVGEIENLIGTRMIFGQETVAEAKRSLELLGLDPENRELVERVRGYRKGRCLMRDIDDRVAEIQVDPVSDEFLRILDTSPRRLRAAA